MVERQLPKLHTRVRFPSPARLASRTARPRRVKSTNARWFCAVRTQRSENRQNRILKPKMLSSVHLFSLCTEHRLVVEHRGADSSRKMRQSQLPPTGKGA